MIGLDEGFDIRIFTARVCPQNDVARAIMHIDEWCLKHIGRVLPVTCIKNFDMLELWDDRCVQVAKNFGFPTSSQKNDCAFEEGGDIL